MEEAEQPTWQRSVPQIVTSHIRHPCFFLLSLVETHNLDQCQCELYLGSTDMFFSVEVSLDGGLKRDFRILHNLHRGTCHMLSYICCCCIFIFSSTSIWKVYTGHDFAKCLEKTQNTNLFNNCREDDESTLYAQRECLHSFTVSSVRRRFALGMALLDRLQNRH